MKNLFIIISTFLIACSTVKKQERLFKEESLYGVYKIDSINNYYLIYASKNDSLYKIVSSKEKKSNCNLIKKGSSYKFNLVSIKENAPLIGGIKIKPINYMDVNCYQFDKETSICKEKGIYDLYLANNIKGLCFIND